MPPILYDILSWPTTAGPSDTRAALALLWVMFGAGAVFTGFFLIMRLASRYRTTAPRALGETVTVAAVISVAILTWTGRLPPVWLLYVLPFPVAAIGYALWDRFGRSGPRRSKSQMRTTYLKMVLDHDTGLFDGLVIKGTYRGTALSTMTLDELRLLQVEVSPDPESVHILNTYLDHAHAGARREETGDAGANGKTHQSSRQANGGMGEEEARDLLGLSRGASADEIKASHRRLIKQVHPDHGGTDYLAHKINQAKDLLLGL